jgi:hypothetical protein
VFPALTSLLSALAESFAATRPSARLQASVLELSLAVLKIDPVAFTALEVLQTQHHAVLVALHRAAGTLAASVFALSGAVGQRKTILVELLGMLNQVYASKVPYRSYLVQQSSAVSSGSRDGNPDGTPGTAGASYTSMVFVTLLMCAQSAVALQDCLPDMSSAAVMSIPATESVTGKGGEKRGKGKKNTKAADRAHDGDTTTMNIVAATGPSEALPSKETAGRSLYPAYACCAMFVAELFQVIFVRRRPLSHVRITVLG